MQAIIATGGKQYLVSKDDVLDIELVGDHKKLEFDVLMTIDGDAIKVGTPLVEGASVTAEVIDEDHKGEKLKIMRFKAKKRVKRLTGHRQHYSQIKITKIS